jgi:hypothetical protein
MSSPVVTNTSAQLNGGSMVVGFATALTDAQIKALPTTPVLVKAAPGAGFRLKVMGASIRVNSTAGVYTNVNTTSCTVVLTHTDATDTYLAIGPVNIGTLTTPITAATEFFSAAASYTADFVAPGVFGHDSGAVSGGQEWVVSPMNEGTVFTENLGVFLCIDNHSSGNLTGGNASNSGVLTIYVAYEAV